jgi:hypothetical protein
MIRHPFLGRVALAAGFLLCTCQAQAVSILNEPFAYAEGNFFAGTADGTAVSPTTPAGPLAPNFNNWYVAAANTYQAANDGTIGAADLSVTGLAHTPGTKSLTVGGTGHIVRLSLNTSTQAQPNQTSSNATDTADPLAGTDNTLQATDTGHTGYYSVLLRVNSLMGMVVNQGGVLLGFNNVIGGQTGALSTIGAGLTLRPKATAGQFELGIVKNGATNSANATWDTTNTYTINSTILVVGKYQTVGPLQGGTAGTDDVASLWINPAASTFGGFDPAGALTSTGAAAGADITTSAATNGHTLQSFVFRQPTSDATQLPSSITYDDLRVGTNWADVTPIAPTSVPGDFNGNGKVDAGDYVLWRNGGPLANEVTGVGIVTEADYTDWRARFGNTLGSGGGSAVPEPAAASLAMIVASMFSTRRKNRR